MYPLLKQQLRGYSKFSLSYYRYLIDHCLSLKSIRFAKAIHCQILKVGLYSNTFLGNRCLDVYARYGTIEDVLGAFHAIPNKNLVSWNICLKGLLRCGDTERARLLFDQMNVRDVVSWNSMIKGCASNGLVGSAFELFMKLQCVGVRPTEFTYSILLAHVWCSLHGRQIHAHMIRSGGKLDNVVLGNSLINMYGKLSLFDYAFSVFQVMRKVDIISWNSLISASCSSGHMFWAFKIFYLMHCSGPLPNEFTVSLVISICSKSQDLERGKQTFALCMKMGFLSNTVVASAVIDLFSKCNRLEDSVQFFDEVQEWDMMICNSMIASYVSHGCWEVSLQLFQLVLKKDLKPTEYTLSIVLSAVSFFPAEQGNKVHSFVIKSGFESESVVANSLMEMYSKIGLIDYAMKIFQDMHEKDLIAWNTLIMGLTYNGRTTEALHFFSELLRAGLEPDRITFLGVLQACNYGKFIDEGMFMFSLMEEYGVVPETEHYACILNMLSRSSKLKEMFDIAQEMPYEPSSEIWEEIIQACVLHGSLELLENLEKGLIKKKPLSPLSYLVLARGYEMRGRWEGIIRIRRAMKEQGVDKPLEFSWISIKNYVFIFRGDQLLHTGSRDIHFVLRLLSMEYGLDNHNGSSISCKGKPIKEDECVPSDCS